LILTGQQNQFNGEKVVFSLEDIGRWPSICEIKKRRKKKRASFLSLIPSTKMLIQN